MIGNITYEYYQKIIVILENSNNNLKKIIEYYTKGNIKVSSMKINRFTEELENYIEYLKSTYKINIDADKALITLRELNK